MEETEGSWTEDFELPERRLDPATYANPLGD
jgi:hypothetical protein